jgi:hypothetical protein
MLPAGQHDPAAGPRVEADAPVACLTRRRARSRRRVHLGDLRRDLENILRRFCQTPPRRRSGPSYTECERALLQIVAPEVKRRGSTLCPSARFRRERALPPDHAKRHRRGAMPDAWEQFGSRAAAPVGRGGHGRCSARLKSGPGRPNLKPSGTERGTDPKPQGSPGERKRPRGSLSVAAP